MSLRVLVGVKRVIDYAVKVSFFWNLKNLFKSYWNSANLLFINSTSLDSCLTRQISYYLRLTMELNLIKFLMQHIR